LIAAALKNRQTRIFREAGINERKIAAKEDGAAVGFDAAGMLAIAAQAGIGLTRGSILSRHTFNRSLASGFQSGAPPREL